MEILLGNDLKLRSLNPRNPQDVWLAQELDKDELVYGPKGYLWSIKEDLGLSCPNRDTIYDSSYSIYKKENPVGYLYISDLFIKEMFVLLSYAVLKTERKKGYMGHKC